MNFNQNILTKGNDRKCFGVLGWSLRFPSVSMWRRSTDKWLSQKMRWFTVTMNQEKGSTRDVSGFVRLFYILLEKKKSHFWETYSWILANNIAFFMNLSYIFPLKIYFSSKSRISAQNRICPSKWLFCNNMILSWRLRQTRWMENKWNAVHWSSHLECPLHFDLTY